MLVSTIPLSPIPIAPISAHAEPNTTASKGSKIFFNFCKNATQDAYKVGSFTVQFTAGFAIGTLGLAAFLFIRAPFRGFCYAFNQQYTKTDKLKAAIDQQNLAALQSTLHLKLFDGTFADFQKNQEALLKTMTSYPAINKKEACQFLAKVGNILASLQKGKRPAGLRKMIDSTLKSNIYQALKKTDHPAIEFIQILCMKFMGGIPNHLMSGKQFTPFLRYGQQLIGEQNKSTFTLGELASFIKGQTFWFHGFQNNNLFTKIIYFMSNPDVAWYSLVNNMSHPLTYNTHAENPSVFGFDYTYGGKTLIFYYGPGPTGDSLFKEGYLVALEKDKLLGVKKPQLFERRVNYQKLHGKELQRGLEMQRWANEMPSTFQIATMSFDTPMIQNPNLQPDTPVALYMANLKKEFLAKSRETDELGQMKNDKGEKENRGMGVYLSQGLIDDNGLQVTLNTLEQAFTKLARNNTFVDKLRKTQKGNRRLGRLLTVGTYGALGLARIFKALKDSPNPNKIEREAIERLDADLLACRVSGACKQDIDRGVVANIIERIFFKLATSEKGTITKEELYSIVGVVIGRAYVADERLIMWARCEILVDLFNFIGSEENAKELGSALKTILKQYFK